MENPVMVKTETHNNGEILLFYVDENGGNESVITTIENIEETQLEQLEETFNENIQQSVDYETSGDASASTWVDEETRRLLIFYTDNKEIFQGGTTKRNHLWTVACKTMLTDKSPIACEMKLQSLKNKYMSIQIELVKKSDVTVDWQFYEMCHHAFYDDSTVVQKVSDSINLKEETATIGHEETPSDHIVVINKTSHPRTYPNEKGALGYEEKPSDHIVVINKTSHPRTYPDEKVARMLELYLQHKKVSQESSLVRHFWDKIADELGEDAEYWHKRFLNFKQHYIRLVDKRKYSEPGGILWPYMNLFDEIFGNDPEFQKKFVDTPKPSKSEVAVNEPVRKVLDWDDTERTVLVKYCFDCFDEFQDKTIPNSVLWNEISRLLDKTPEECIKKYQELRQAHIDLYLVGGYDLRTRKPISILFDNIISKEMQIELVKALKRSDELQTWTMEELDELVQFFYDNLTVFKDPICHNVCWQVISKKISRSVQDCRRHWRELTILYKTVLEDKKEDPGMQIDWRYIELFDRIFDYGMDVKLLNGYEVDLPTQKISAGIPKRAKTKEVTEQEEVLSDNEEYDESGCLARSNNYGDPKQFKILEYYFKHKDKFTTTARKQALWSALAEEIGLTAEQCAHRFRNLKQVYTAYIQREINKPDMPILWPYYILCKKVFGYRAIKNKLKNSTKDHDMDNWSAKEIKQLISFVSKNLDEISNHTEDINVWTSLAEVLGKRETLCKEKFLDLRKSYRKIKNMTSRPGCKINWKYFKLMDDVYSGASENMQLDGDSTVPVTSENNNENQDDDYQCIIVIPEGQDIADLSNAQIINKENENKPQTDSWNKKEKKQLCLHYLQYLKAHKGEIINRRNIWDEMATKFSDKTRLSCQRRLIQMKAYYRTIKKTQPDRYKKLPLRRIFNEIFAQKPKLMRPGLSVTDYDLKNDKSFSDVSLPLWKVEKALKYYLEHLERFVSPNIDAKLAWGELAADVSMSGKKLFRKIQYLKQFYNPETNDVNGEYNEFGDLIKEILEKEFAVKISLSMVPDSKPEETIWTDDQVDQLLNWYLENLDKFKDPTVVTSQLWTEASTVMDKSALECSNKMSEIRCQYKSMVKENSEELQTWKFLDLCQKIYGTGKRNSDNSEPMEIEITQTEA